MDFSTELEARVEHFDHFLNQYIQHRLRPSHILYGDLADSVAYSLTNGGKRFRPMLVYLTAEAFAVGPDRVAPWAAAVEMVHTYSLIHDDLPCMDNDDLRRGQPANHKVFGEAIALLAGDALLTESFAAVAEGFRREPELVVKLIQLLANRAGFKGMVAGQVMDMKAKLEARDEAVLLKMQSLKTGALIKASVEGTGLILGLSELKQKALASFGEHLGLAFQLADDLLDSQEAAIEAGSLAERIGLSELRNRLENASNEAMGQVKELGIEKSLLAGLVEFNQSRKK